MDYDMNDVFVTLGLILFAGFVVWVAAADVVTFLAPTAFGYAVEALTVAAVVVGATCLVRHYNE